MYITRIKLNKHKRLMLSNIQEFEWTPKKNLMVILGANGSGKSSIIEELTPLPSRHVNFIKDGSKEFDCIHGSSSYQLKSIYSSGTGKHSFIKDEEELNSGGTFKIQEELCLQEFGLTREIHDIAIGKIKFSNLNTAKRRDLLTRMSPVDLNYAFEIYNRVRHEHRSQKGVIDLLTKRLITENHDVPSDNEISQLKEETNKLTERLNNLFKERINHNESNFDNLEEAEDQMEYMFRRVKLSLKDYIKIPEEFKLDNPKALDKLEIELKQQELNNNNLINRLAEEIEKLKTLKDSEDIESELEHLKKVSFELNENINSNELKLKGYDGEFPIWDITVDSRQDLDTLDSVFNQWHELLINFPLNENYYFGRDKALANTNLQKEKKNELIGLEDRFSVLKSRIKMVKECETLECPNCNHNFKPGVTKEEYDQLVKDAKEIPLQITRVENELKEINEYLEEYEIYHGFMLRFRRLINEFPNYMPLWDYCIYHEVMQVNPRIHINSALKWFEFKKLQVTNVLLKKDLNINNEKIKTLESLDLDSVKYMKNRRDSLQKEMSELYEDNVKLTVKEIRINQTRNLINGKIKEIESILEDFNVWKEKAKSQVDYYLCKAYDSEIGAIQLKLADTTRTLSELEQKETTIKTLENEVNNSSGAHKDLGHLIKGLSPNGGLIGNYLLTFMQGVVTLVNAYINEVWSHPLEVLPSKIDKDELDYNFPIMVADGAVVTNDISEGSESQIDIVNFAFRLTILKFLKVKELPLYLDEFGRTFDEQHRANLIPFITNLVDNGLFKQVFFVSHLSGIHGAFNLAEFAVINSSNITVPDVYNENVIIG